MYEKVTIITWHRAKCYFTCISNAWYQMLFYMHQQNWLLYQIWIKVTHSSIQGIGSYTRALNGRDNEAWSGLIWAASVVTAYTYTHSSRRDTPHHHLIKADAQELSGKSRLFKTISFVVYAFLYLTYYATSYYIPHHWLSIHTSMTIKIS